MSSRTDAALLQRLVRDFPELVTLPAGAFIVGGAVRDALLERVPVDIDIAGFRAANLARDFANLIRGTLVQLGQQRFATYRVVVEGRIYDFNEIVGDSIEQDLRRRDFTLNAIALEVNGRFIDIAGGEEDVRSRRLRMVDEANFRDDPLRVLKGVRLAVAFDLAIEPATFDAMKRHASSVTDVAAERIATELDQIIASPRRAAGLALLHDLGLDLYLFGFPLPGQTTEADDPLAAYVLIFLSQPPGTVDSFAERWRWSERQRRSVLSIIALVNQADEQDPRLLIYDYGVETARSAIAVLRALGRDVGGLEVLVKERGAAIARTVPLLDGEEIQRETVISAGPEIGRLKRLVLEAQLRGEITTRDEAVELVKRASKGVSS